jgi:hypothetical protein
MLRFAICRLAHLINLRICDSGMNKRICGFAIWRHKKDCFPISARSSCTKNVLLYRPDTSKTRKDNCDLSHTSLQFSVPPGFFIYPFPHFFCDISKPIVMLVLLLYRNAWDLHEFLTAKYSCMIEFFRGKSTLPMANQ